MSDKIPREIRLFISTYGSDRYLSSYHEEFTKLRKSSTIEMT